MAWSLELRLQNGSELGAIFTPGLPPEQDTVLASASLDKGSISRYCSINQGTIGGSITLSPYMQRIFSVAFISLSLQNAEKMSPIYEQG